MNEGRDQGGRQVVPIGDGVIWIRLKSEALPWHTRKQLRLRSSKRYEKHLLERSGLDVSLVVFQKTKDGGGRRGGKSTNLGD